MKVLTVANFKGGSGKSTTAGHLAHAFEHLGYRTALVDSDPQATMTRWAERAGEDWTLPVLPMTKERALRDLGGYVDPARFDVAVIDTPPLELQRKLTLAALGQATDVVIPMAASFSDWDSLPPMWPALEEERVKPDRVSVLFNAVRGAVGHRTYRGRLETSGRHALRIFVPALERYAQAMAFPVEMTSADYYYLAAEEIQQRGGWTR